MTPDAFRAWSLQVFIALLAYDAVRILIWLDHMGLRVATLVNLSFLGMDKLEQWLARILAPAATARCIPEGVKRFTTWGPLLIPFYIPRGKDWDYAWATAEAIHSREPQGVLGLAHLLLPCQHVCRFRRGCRCQHGAFRGGSRSESSLGNSIAANPVPEPLLVRGETARRRRDHQPDSGARR